MNTAEKLLILAKGKKKPNFGGKRNAVPKSSGGRRDTPTRGGGTKAALLRRIHRDPDIQKLLKNNPKYDIIVVRKSKVKASEGEFEKREQAKKNLAQARKDLLAAKKAGNTKLVDKIRQKIARYEEESTSDYEKEMDKKFGDWNQELIRRKKVGGYD